MYALLDDVNFTMDSKPRRMFLAIEKSMYQNISEEMLKMFPKEMDINSMLQIRGNKCHINIRLPHSA